MIILYFSACIQDRRTAASPSRQQPTIDAQQDWMLSNGTQSLGFTTLEFFRPIDTGDTAGDLVIGEVYCTPVI